MLTACRVCTREPAAEKRHMPPLQKHAENWKGFPCDEFMQHAHWIAHRRQGVSASCENSPRDFTAKEHRVCREHREFVAESRSSCERKQGERMFWFNFKRYTAVRCFNSALTSWNKEHRNPKFFEIISKMVFISFMRIIISTFNHTFLPGKRNYF